MNRIFNLLEQICLVMTQIHGYTESSQQRVGETIFLPRILDFRGRLSTPPQNSWIGGNWWVSCRHFHNHSFLSVVRKLLSHWFYSPLSQIFFENQAEKHNPFFVRQCSSMSTLGSLCTRCLTWHTQINIGPTLFAAYSSRYAELVNPSRKLFFK